MNKASKFILGSAAVVAVSAGVAGFTAYSMMPEEQNKTLAFDEVFQQNPNTRLAALDAVDMQPVDLTKAAENSVHAVVHIKSTQESKTQTVTVRDPFYEFFGDMFGNRGGQQRQVLLCAVRDPQYYRIKAIINEVDPNAFLIAAEASEILGYGFNPLNTQK